MKTFIKCMILICSLFAMSGCGGGGGDGGGSAVVKPGDPAEAQATKAVLKLSTQGSLPEGTSITGIYVTVNLPAGMTVATDGSGNVNSDAIAVSGTTVAAQALADFTPTDGGARLTLLVTSSETAGLGTGEFATINCNIAAGSFPKATDITLTGFRAVDPHSTTINGLSVTHTAEFK